ncbi:hypothetical protein ACQCN2_01220 [Brevibacillus ginsengisoli]|uniref:hypothetical protein n=1 Tax=Brevibacillus ginsengisoli TaxID=363854 RepID=UPI003CF63029
MLMHETKQIDIKLQEIEVKCLPKWLEPSIERRTDKIFNDLCDERHGFYNKFINSIKSTNIENDLIFDLENIFILMARQAIDISYRSGLSDMNELKK